MAFPDGRSWVAPCVSDQVFATAADLAVAALVERDLGPTTALAESDPDIRLIAVHLLRVLAKEALAVAERHGVARADIIAKVMADAIEVWETPRRDEAA